LTGDDYEREATCWEKAPLEQFEERGEKTGLAAFIREVRKKLVPLWTGPAPSAG
jgi:hypothetical protein